MKNISIFHSSEFLNAFYGSTWMRFSKQADGAAFEHTPVLNEIDDTGLYYSEAWRGYAEPYFSGNSVRLTSALNDYSAWCREQAIVCELLRLDPHGKLLSHLPKTADAQIRVGQPVAILRVPSDYQSYLRSLPLPCQRILRAGAKRLTVEIIRHDDAAAIAAAAEMHLRSLNRVGAAKKWVVRAESLAALAALPNFVCVGIRHVSSQTLVSFGGALFDQRALHVLLVGNSLGEWGRGACDLLYATFVQQAIERGSTVSHIYFGGGRSLDGSDSLFRFKLKYSLGEALSCNYLAVVHDKKAAEQLATRPKPERVISEPLGSLQRECFPFL
ncbi:hypothetical protein [Pandoraea sp. NPDC087047]|uniref:hypothetical protein n=1 Tax=Pandoraea sp. NPDC087047 TaxID=3364390 RepID=UPI0038197FCE